MDRMISTVAKLAQSGNRNDDDIIDRLHHRYTVLFLVVFTVIISTTQYVGTPIHCWSPGEFEESHQKYTDRICWISNTYNLPKDAVPGHPGNRKRYVNYYQWVPIALLTQAIMFRLPSLFWRLFSDRSGINVNNLVEAAETIQNALYPERREKTIRYMIRHLDHYLDYQRDYRGGACDSCQQCISRSRSRFLRGILCGNRLGNYLVTLYAITKFLYLGNVAAQFYLLDRFLGGEYHMYGVRVIMDLVQGGWRAAMSREQEAFPRVTLCDFEMRQLGNVHAHTVQCVLPLNFFSEKIYLALWFWLAALGLASFVSICSWAWVLLPVHGRRRYVRRNLKIMSRIKSSSDGSSALGGGGSGSSMERDRERKMSRRFAENYLRQDGVFVLKLVAKNSTDLVVADIVAALWDNYRLKPPPISMGDRCQMAGHGGDASSVIGGSRGGRHESPSIAYVGDNDLPLDAVDII